MTKYLVSVEFIEKIDDEISRLKVTFSDGFEAHIFAELSQIQEMINHEVIVNFRTDIYKGARISVCADFSMVTKINVIEREGSIKLYTEAPVKTFSSISFGDIEEGQPYKNVILYCDKATKESSTKANWIQFTVLDKNSEVETMRLFDPTLTDPKGFEGTYVVVNFTKGKYGLQATSVTVYPELKAENNPEYELARNYVMQVVNSINDPTMLKLIDDNQLLDRLSLYASEEPGLHRGHLLQELAIELGLAQEYRNLARDLNYKLLVYAILVDKLFVCTDNSENMLSLEVQTVNALQRQGLYFNKLIIACLGGKERMLERELLLQAKQTSRLLVTSKYVSGVFPSSDRKWGTK